MLYRWHDFFQTIDEIELDPRLTTFTPRICHDTGFIGPDIVTANIFQHNTFLSKPEISQVLDFPEVTNIQEIQVPPGSRIGLENPPRPSSEMIL